MLCKYSRLGKVVKRNFFHNNYYCYKNLFRKENFCFSTSFLIDSSFEKSFCPCQSKNQTEKTYSRKHYSAPGQRYENLDHIKNHAIRLLNSLLCPLGKNKPQYWSTTHTLIITNVKLSQNWYACCPNFSCDDHCYPIPYLCHHHHPCCCFPQHY